MGLFSDSQQLWGIGHYGPIAEQLAAQDFSFISCVGDLVQEGEDQADWNLFMKQGEVWAQHTPFVPVIGNHDYDESNPDASFYPQYYNYTNGNHFYYSFNWSNVQFVIGEISTTSTREDGGDFNVTMHDEWLNSTLLAGQDKTFRILMFHRNLMTSTTSDITLIERITPIAEDYNISLVIFGHNHHYERLLYNGRRYLCLGGGGGMQDGAFRIIPESEFLNIGPSFTRISFLIGEMVVETFSENNELIDGFTLVAEGSNAALKEEVA